MDTQTIPTCYRHPDRETRLSCTVCDRPVCTDCVRVAPVGQRCPECARSETTRVVSGFDRTPFVTYTLMAISIGVFLAGTVPALADVLYGFGAQANTLVARGEWWRPLTAAFLHGGLMHLAFNMYALYLFGPTLERQVGAVPYLAMYVASALAGGAMYYVLAPDGLAVGASGAVFGLFGAWLVASFRSRHTAAGQAAVRQLGVLLLINAVIGFTPGTRIAWQAHLGGLIAGALIAWLWARLKRSGPMRTRALVAVAVGAVAFAVILLA